MTEAALPAALRVCLTAIVPNPCRHQPPRSFDSRTASHRKTLWIS